MQTAWKGNLSFGLLTLPVRMYKATSKGGVSFRSLHVEDAGPIREKRICSVCGEEVAWKDLVKGYEIADGKFVTVTKAELEAIEPESTSNLEIREFVPIDAVDPAYFQSSYVLAPEKGGAKAYGLLHKVLSEERKAAIGKVATRGREHLAAVRPGEGLLYVEIMHFPEEVRDLSEVRDSIKIEKPGAEELEIAKLLVDRLTREWDPSKYHDEYARRVHDLIEAKARGGTIDVETPAASQPATKDLLEALRASLTQASREKEGAEG